MREIKFKVWDEHYKKMRDNLPIANSDLKNLFSQMLQGHLIPLQFTGVLDKKGIEIYEGDILKVKFFDKENAEANEEYTAIIQYSEFNFGFELLEINGGFVESEFWNYKELWSFEIIGNIYQNQELIKNYEKDNQESGQKSKTCDM